jgi:hypothetical protein
VTEGERNRDGERYATAQGERENRHGERARDIERYKGKDTDSYRHR